MPTFQHAVLRIGDGTNWVDIIGPGSGWKMADPKWRPNVSQFKGGGSMVDSAQAEGQALVYKQYGNVVETIPLILDAANPDQGMQTLRDLLQILKQASDYDTESYEYDQVWIETKPSGQDFLLGYSKVVKGSVPQYDPFNQPFIGATYPNSVMENITLILERKPFWRTTQPGTVLGPLYNYIRNPDFELWNLGVANSQPDNWTDLQSLWIAGTNNRETTGAQWGRYALKVDVTGSTNTGAFKGVSQTLEDTKNNTEYTIIAWVRSDGVTNGVARVLVNYSNQLEIYRSSDAHGWKLYVGTITTEVDDVVSINCEILTIAPNTVGSFYVDGLMLVEGDFETEAKNNVIPYLSGSHIVNHMDDPNVSFADEGDINFVDVWNIPGDVDSLIKLEFKNNTDPADDSNPIESYEFVKIGMRRTGNIFNFNNRNDPPGLYSTATSSDNYIFIDNPNDSYKIVTTWVTTGTNLTRDNEGRFRLLIRIFDELAVGTPTLTFRVRYFIGRKGINDKILSEYTPGVTDQWSILDLTKNESIIFEQKDSDIPANQFGYSIEAKRTVGSDDARVDYSLLMPTDGGYISAQIKSSLQYKDSLVVSNASGKTIVRGVNTKEGIQILYETVSGIRSLVEYNDILYIGTENGELYKYEDGIGELLHDYGANAITSLGVYNNFLHVASGNNVYATKGDVFPGDEQYDESGGIWTLYPFGGYLWTGTQTDAELFRWDGTTNTSIIDTGDTVLRAIQIYEGNLYLGTDSGGGTGKIWVYNPNNGITTLSTTFAAGVAVWSLEIFNGKLYAGTNNQRIYSFDGNIWEEKTDFTGNLQTILDMQTLNDKLFAVGAVGGIDNPIYQTEDGDTWVEIYDNQETFSTVMILYQGNLYLGTLNLPGVGNLYAVYFEENIFNITEYEGTSFLAPNRTFSNEKRHRYFFNYTRPNFIDNISDKALVGIGFVPRYLTLINKEEIPIGE